MMENKKIYVSPKIQVFNLKGCGILAASNDSREMSSCYCPHVPETKCELYCEFVKRKFGSNKEALKKIKKGILRVPCPNKDCCEDYQWFCKMTNEKQH